MADLTHVMHCGEPVDQVTESGHAEGCWLGEAEALAAEAYEEACLWQQPPIVAVVAALRGAGLLRDPAQVAEMVGLLDALSETGLLRAREPKGGEPR
jgi:hypothetical protein